MDPQIKENVWRRNYAIEITLIVNPIKKTKEWFYLAEEELNYGATFAIGDTVKEAIKNLEAIIYQPKFEIYLKEKGR